MYEVFKSVITSGNYELSNMLSKIDTIWVQGQIADEQRTELINLARQYADPEQSYAPLQNQVDALFNNVLELSGKVIDLESRVATLEGGEPEPAPEPEEYPEYVQPTGAHDAYHNGDKITYNDKKYDCVAPEGVAVVWNPDEYPACWKEVTEESTEDTEEPDVEPTE